MLSKFQALLTDNAEMSERNQRLASIIFLAIAGAMSFREYVQVRWLWDYHLTIRPGLISTVVAVLMVAPLYLRGILKWNRSIYTLISLVLILMVFASFLELALGGNGRGQVITAIIVMALVLSWLGIKEVAGVCWILAFAAGMFAAISNNLAMGFSGFIYITCGFLGLAFHSKLNPGQLVSGIRSEYD